LFVGFQVYDGNLGCIGKEGANSDGFLVAGTHNMGPENRKRVCMSRVHYLFDFLLFRRDTSRWVSLHIIIRLPVVRNLGSPEGSRQPSSALGNGGIVPVRRFAVCDNFA
jgi:hypothetical protein